MSLPIVFAPQAIKPVIRRDIAIAALIVLAGQLLFVPSTFYFNHPKQLTHYIKDILNPIYSTPDSIRHFPANWRSRIRQGTVDIVPNDVASIYLNDLTKAYRPRPIFQSYQVTNRYLDSLNVSFYQSVRAPEYIIYTHAATDNRYSFADEVRTRLTILRYYNLVDKGSKQWMLLKRRAAPHKLDTLSVSKINGQLQTAIDVATTSPLQLIQIQVNYSLLGKVTRFFFQPPTLTLDLETSDGRWHPYQASTTLLANGFIANRWVPDNLAFQHFLLSKGQHGFPIRRIRVSTPRWIWSLEPTIQITSTQLSLSESA